MRYVQELKKKEEKDRKKTKKLWQLFVKLLFRNFEYIYSCTLL